MSQKKFGIWCEYTGGVAPQLDTELRTIIQQELDAIKSDWLRDNNGPILFDSEHSAKEEVCEQKQYNWLAHLIQFSVRKFT